MAITWASIRKEIQEYKKLKVDFLEEKKVWFDKKLELHLIEKKLEKGESENGNELHRKKDSIADQLPLLQMNYMKVERQLEDRKNNIKRKLDGLNTKYALLTTMDTDTLTWINEFLPTKRVVFSLGASASAAGAEFMRDAVLRLGDVELITGLKYELYNGNFRVLDDLEADSSTRTRKRQRSISLLTAASFEGAVIQIYRESEGDLKLVAKKIGSSELDFSRHGDTFFEIVFVGVHMQQFGRTTSNVVLNYPYILGCEPLVDDILPFVTYIHDVLLDRPFLLKNLEKVTSKMLHFLQFRNEKERKSIAMFIALVFTEKRLGLQPNAVFQPLLRDDLVSDGLALSFITDFFKQYLGGSNFEDLKSLLNRGKVEDKLLQFLPVAKRTQKSFIKHLTKAGLLVLVEYYWNQIFEEDVESIKCVVRVSTLEEDITEQIEIARKHVKEFKKNNDELVGIVWKALMGAIDEDVTVELANSQVEIWKDTLLRVCSSRKLNRRLLYKIQDWCHKDIHRISFFPGIIRCLYKEKVLTKVSVLYWYEQGTNENGREEFLQLLLPFVEELKEDERVLQEEMSGII